MEKFPLISVNPSLFGLTVEFGGGAEHKMRDILQGLEKLAKVSPQVASKIGKDVIEASIEQNRCHEYEFDVFLGLRLGRERKRVHAV